MRKIRIKVKHLLYIALGLFLTVFYLLPNAMFIYAEAMEKRDIEASKVYYKRYIEMFPFGGRRAEALYNLAQSIVPDYNVRGRYIIYADCSSWGDMITSDMIKNASVYYKKILEEYKDTKYYEKAYGSLIGTYILGGMFDEANNLIEKGLRSENEGVVLAASKYKMLYLIVGREYGEAEKIGCKYMDEGLADADIYMLMGDINFYSRDLEEALEYYNRAEERTRWQMGGSQDEFKMGYYKEARPESSIDVVKRMMGGYSGNNIVKGKVTVNGKPAPFVQVYLKDEEKISSIGYEDRYIKAITDFNGYYEIPSVPDGGYTVGIGISPVLLEDTRYQTPAEGYFYLEGGEEKEYDFTFSSTMKLIKPKGNVIPVDGKVEVQWEEVEGASYYLLRLVMFETSENSSSYVTFSADDRIFGTSYTMNIDALNMRSSGFMIDDEGRYNPQAYMGVFHPGSSVPIFVEAYDSRGNMIKSSVPMRLNFDEMTVINIHEEGLTEGDKLILERKPEEAIESYKSDLEKNPEDIHALRMLSKIYSLGTRVIYLEGGGEEAENRDFKKALEYANRLYSITGDISYVKNLLSMHMENREDFELALREYLKIPEEHLKGEDYSRIGDLYLRLKNYSKADNYYEKAYKEYRDTDSSNMTPVILKIYLGDYDGSLKFVRSFEPRLYAIEKHKLEENIEKLKAMDKASQDYRNFEDALRLALELKGSTMTELEFKAIYNRVKDPVLLEILEAVGNYYHLFQNY